jgi:hypothetical protein
MFTTRSGLLASTVLLAVLAVAGGAEEKPPTTADNDPPRPPLAVNPAPIASAKSVNWDYDIVYVRVPRFRGTNAKRQKLGSLWAEIGHPTQAPPGADLVLLHPDGREEVLVEAGKGSVQDPYVSFDGEWVYYSFFHDPQAGEWTAGADIYKLHVKSRKVVRLTYPQATPNTGVADWAGDFKTPRPGKATVPHGIYNIHPCPLPGGKVAFVSNRDSVKTPHGYPQYALQLFTMDEAPADRSPPGTPGGERSADVAESNVEKIGHLNVACALHPVVLKDGRLLFSSLESQGLHGNLLWGIWSIHPDGTQWRPVVSAFFGPGGATDAFHFQTQLSDGSIILEEYYNQNTAGFGTYYKLPPRPADGQPAFRPAADARSGQPDPRLQHWGGNNGGVGVTRYPFFPRDIEVLTRFAHASDFPAGLSDPKDPKSPRVGKVTHPCGAPDNHLLTVWARGAAPSANRGPITERDELPVDAGIYLIEGGKPVWEPGRMLLVKNDPDFNETWPRPLVPYKRIYGVEEPQRLPALANDGTLNPHLPEGTPFGLVGTSSLYKRESFPFGAVPKDGVTATGDPYLVLLDGGTYPPSAWNWRGQGADAGVYDNRDIHAIRILALEPGTSVVANRFHNGANERLRILGEIPVRKFPPSPPTPLPPGARGERSPSPPTSHTRGPRGERGERQAPRPSGERGGGEGGQPLDPDGNPDTSFLARIPADTAFTFQMLDKDGMVLTMAQTWHQVRPGEIRADCGGCHAHSQQPTDFKLTAAAKPDYAVWDLTRRTPLLTARKNDESGKKWDVGDETGVRQVRGPLNVEYFRDVRPILDRSCVACHTQKDGKPAADLALDDDTRVRRPGYDHGPMPATYYRLAGQGERYSNKLLPFSGSQPPGGNSFTETMSLRASPYVWMFQSRRSLLVWKILGRRTDGLPDKPLPGHESQHQAARAIDFTGSIMPPPKAVEGTYEGPDGRKIKVAPLSDEDRRTLIRWIDLGCPLDLDYDPAKPQAQGRGWMLDDQRPTLTLTYPRAGANPPLTRLLVGMYDYGSGLDLDSFQVSADFPVDGVPAGTNLAPRFQALADGRWELRLARPLAELPKGKLTVSVKDRQGNVSRIERTFSVAAPESSRR